MMEVVYPRCAGVDIHKETVVACRLVPDQAGSVTKEIRTFGTMTPDLLQLADWLQETQTSHVAMEATGVYWKPIWNLLEDQFTLLLVNARHVKAVPGRKTDVKDSEWLADLLRHGLLRPSFVPPRPARELRELTRYRTSLIAERSREANRIQKTLEGANFKLGSVASNVLGVSGRAILDALVAGHTDPALLAELAQGKLRDKRPALERALAGRVAPHLQFLLAHQLSHLDDLDALIETVSAEIAERLRPFDAVRDRLDAIPGIGKTGAEVILSEVGLLVDRFPTAGHFASWIGVCPGNHESAGKRASGRARKGNQALRTHLVQAAHATRRTKGTFLGARYRRLAGRLGSKKAALAVAHSLAIAIYHMLRSGAAYEELGAEHGTTATRDREAGRHRRALERLGYQVVLTEGAA
jgi:transposase